jgi:mannan polymerase II complex MNN11 subunit
MERNSAFKVKRKQSPVLPIWLPKSFGISLSSKEFTFKDYLPIIILLFILNLVLTGNIIPTSIIWLFSTILTPITTIFSKTSAPNSIKAYTESKYLGTFTQHGLTNADSFIPETNKYIFPPVQEAVVLKDIGYEKLFQIEMLTGNSKKKRYLYSPDFFGNVKEKDQSEKSKNSDTSQNKNELESNNANNFNAIKVYENTIQNFKKNGRRIYKGNENPEIVLVTGINYEKLDSSLLVKIIQNRVDYAHENKFAVYSRWVQEFLPLLERTRNNIDEWAKPLIIREAMVAFPNAKWFWYIDETSIIMHNDINIKNYILNDDALEPILLREQPILPPDGIIKTYNNNKPNSLSLIITQTQSGLDTHNFLIKNDLGGHALLDIWMDPKMRMYSGFRKDNSKALAHMLQWHPELLLRTGIIPSRTINSIAISAGHTTEKNSLYHDGDFIISHPYCKENNDCEKKMDNFLSKKKTNKE